MHHTFLFAVEYRRESVVSQNTWICFSILSFFLSASESYLGLNKNACVHSRDYYAHKMLPKYQTDIVKELKILLAQADSITLVADKSTDRAFDNGMLVMAVLPGFKPIVLETVSFGMFFFDRTHQ